MTKTVEQLYEELRKATDGGSESMTHEDAVESVKYMSERVYKLTALLRCVEANLDKGMSKTIQKLQARTIWEELQ